MLKSTSKIDKKSEPKYPSNPDYLLFETSKQKVVRISREDYEVKYNVKWDEGVYSKDGKYNFASLKNIAKYREETGKSFTQYYEEEITIKPRVNSNQVVIKPYPEIGVGLKACEEISAWTLVAIYPGNRCLIEDAPADKTNAVGPNGGYGVYPTKRRVNFAVLPLSFPGATSKTDYFRDKWLSETICFANLGIHTEGMLTAYISLKTILPYEQMGTSYPLPDKVKFHDRLIVKENDNLLYSYIYRRNVITRSDIHREWCFKIVSKKGKYYLSSKKLDAVLDKTVDVVSLDYSHITQSWTLNFYEPLIPPEGLKQYLEVNLEREVKDINKLVETRNSTPSGIQTPASKEKLQIIRTIPVKNISELNGLLRKLNDEYSEKIAHEIANQVVAYVRLKLPILEELLDLIKTYSLTTVPPNMSSFENPLASVMGTGNAAFFVGVPNPYPRLTQVTFSTRNVLCAILKMTPLTPDVKKLIRIPHILIANLVCGLSTIHASALKEMKPSLLQLCRELINQFNAKDLIALLENIDNSFKATMPVPCTRYVATTPTALGELHPEMRKELQYNHKDADWFKSAAHDDYRLDFN